MEYVDGSIARSLLQFKDDTTYHILKCPQVYYCLAYYVCLLINAKYKILINKCAHKHSTSYCYKAVAVGLLTLKSIHLQIRTHWGVVHFFKF